MVASFFTQMIFDGSPLSFEEGIESSAIAPYNENGAIPYFATEQTCISNAPFIEQKESQEGTMERKELARFTVRVLSDDNATWQGEVESGGETFAFQSEMQLLKWLCKKHPQLLPDINPNHSDS